jgi:hypothetical protein
VTLVPPSGSASSQALALEFVAARRDELAEAIALAAHDVLVSDRVGFASVRDGATAAIEAVEAVLAGSYAPSAVSTLNRLALRAIDRGVPLGVLVAAVQASFGVLVAVVGEAEPRAVAAAARASSVVASEVSGTAPARSRSAIARRCAGGSIVPTASDRRPGTWRRRPSTSDGSWPPWPPRRCGRSTTTGRRRAAGVRRQAHHRRARGSRRRVVAALGAP